MEKFTVLSNFVVQWAMAIEGNDMKPLDRQKKMGGPSMLHGELGIQFLLHQRAISPKKRHVLMSMDYSLRVF